MPIGTYLKEGDIRDMTHKDPKGDDSNIISYFLQVQTKIPPPPLGKPKFLPPCPLELDIMSMPPPILEDQNLKTMDGAVGTNQEG